jgi:annexin A7/11
MEGFGTKEGSLIKICANISNSQRQAIKATCNSLYGRYLIADLKSELHGNFEDSMIALFSEPFEYICNQLR